MECGSSFFSAECGRGIRDDSEVEWKGIVQLLKESLKEAHSSVATLFYTMCNSISPHHKEK